MKIFQCKMCGGNLDVSNDTKIVKCKFCDTSQTITTSNEDKILKLFARGNSLRINGEFDKAYNVFEQIIAEENNNAEAYWNLLLCKYGITYVDDYDGKKKPTINRMSVTSILEDDDYKKVIEFADTESKKSYLESSKEISNIQDKILKIIKAEEPYDIFISYKETDEFGDRTLDSVLAQDIYNELIKEGYRVFLSRISLSESIGKDYEPYIYSALQTSKIMILVTTNEEYINAVWVKNEWLRFIRMMEKDSNKKIIPCYKNVDPYDLPKEIRNIQGLDMSKLGFIQDLITGINKLTKKDNNKELINNIITENFQISANIKTINNYFLLAQNAIDSDNQDEAISYCNKILEIAPNNFKAWRLKAKTYSCDISLDNFHFSECATAYIKAIENCPENQKSEITQEAIKEFEKMNMEFISLLKKDFKSKVYTKYIKNVFTILTNFKQRTNGQHELLRLLYLILSKVHAIIKTKNEKDSDIRDYETKVHPDKYIWERYIEAKDYYISLYEIIYENLKNYITLINKKEIMYDYENIENIINIFQEIEFDIYWGQNEIIHSKPWVYWTEPFNEYVEDMSGECLNILNNEERDKRRKESRKISEEKNKIIEKIEKIKEEIIKERIDEYWKNHLEEKKKIENEIKLLENKIYYCTIEINNIKKKEEKKNIEEKIRDLEIEKNTYTGLFNYKKRKNLQLQIEDLNKELKMINIYIESEENKINQKKENLKKSKKSLEKELKKER